MLNNFKVLNKFFELFNEGVVYWSIFLCLVSLFIILNFFDINIVKGFCESLFFDICERMFKGLRVYSGVLDFKILSVVQFIEDDSMSLLDV